MDPITPGLRAIYYLVIFTIECEQVPDEVRQGLELIRVCNVDLQHLIELRIECLSLLERRPKVLQWVNNIIEAANERIMEVGKIIEKCRPDANKGKTSFGRRAAWIFLDSKEFRSHEPIISRHHASVLAELNFLRQILLLAPAESHDGSPGGSGKKKESIAFDNVALLGDMMGGLSVSNPQIPAINPALNPSMSPAMPGMNPSMNPAINQAINNPTSSTAYQPTPVSDSAIPYSPPPPPYIITNETPLRPKSIYNVSAKSSQTPSISSQYSDHVHSRRQSISVDPAVSNNIHQSSAQQKHAGLALLFDDQGDFRPASSLSHHPPQDAIAELPDRPQTFVSELPTVGCEIRRRPIPKASQDFSRQRPQSVSGPSGDQGHQYSAYPGGPKPYSTPDASTCRPCINHTTSFPVQPMQPIYNQPVTHHARASISGYPGSESRPDSYQNRQIYTPWQAPYPAGSVIPDLPDRHSTTPTPSNTSLSEYNTPIPQGDWSLNEPTSHYTQWGANDGISRPSTTCSTHSTNASISAISPQSTGTRPLSNIPSSLLYNHASIGLPTSNGTVNPPAQHPSITPHGGRENTHYQQPANTSTWDNWGGSYDTSFHASHTNPNPQRPGHDFLYP